MTFKALNREFDDVVIIDLLSETERQDWRISEDIRVYLAKSGVPQFQLSCSRKKHVFEALDWCLRRVEESSFILQFSAHGNPDGIGLKSTGEFIPWVELRAPLTKINHAMKGDLVVNMIACQGIEGIAIQSLDEQAEPFFGIVGPKVEISVPDTKQVCEGFYEKMLGGTEIPHIVRDLNAKLGRELLWCRSAQLNRGREGTKLEF